MSTKTASTPPSLRLRLRLPTHASEAAAAHAHLHAIVFDMDGTLTEPLLDFALMKRRLNLLPTDDIVHHLHSLPKDSPARLAADTIVRDMEHAAMVNMTLARGFHPLVASLSHAGVRKAILTRNNLDPVTHLLATHANAHGYTFDPVVTRDCVQPTKPHPDPLLHIARNVWQVEPAHVLMVGDGVDDVACAKAAGAWACWVHTSANQGGLEKLKVEFGVQPDLQVNGLHELLDLLEVVEEEQASASGRPLSAWADGGAGGTRVD